MVMEPYTSPNSDAIGQLIILYSSLDVSWDRRVQPEKKEALVCGYPKYKEKKSALFHHDTKP